MGKPVVNDVVKLTDWDSSGWLQKGGKKPGSRVVFVFASKVYKTDEGKDLTVFFIPSTAYVWDENDPWNAEEMKAWIKEKGNYDPDAYPFDYDECVDLFDYNNEIREDVLERLGIAKYKDDIIAHLDDIAPYGEETEASM